MWKPETSIEEQMSILWVKKTVSTIERFVDDDKRNDIEESAAFTALPPDTSTKNITLGKRKHNSFENALVEVEPLPCELAEKRARKVEAPASSTSVQDNEFYQMVMSKYAVKEGL